MTAELYVGLMSGTSMDGVDAALVNLQADSVQVIATHCEPMPREIFQALTNLTKPQFNEIHLMAQMDRSVAELFAKACTTLLSHAKISPDNVKAIGSHGQTIRHSPNLPQSYTLQLGDPNTIAELTGITTVADFRRRDLAVGGQGAPLVPGFHSAVFHHSSINRVVVNIGGIANITYIPMNNNPIIGFDTGPGNTLLDRWIQKHLGKSYDNHGAWAMQGKTLPNLLDSLLTDPYFQRPPPKSTGQEHFHLDWLHQHFESIDENYKAVDIQATLLELTAISIVRAIEQYCPETGQILLCGGGTHNRQLVSKISQLCSSPTTVHSTQEFGIPPDWVEAIAFAWMAKRTLNGLPSNLPSVTGAKDQVILGGIYQKSL